MVGGISNSGTSRTRPVVGWYWISSNTSVRRTTEPAETARFPPTSTCSYRRWWVPAAARAMSRTRRRPPFTRFAPPLSIVSRITAGFDHGKFVGARASSTLPGDETCLAFGAPVELGVIDQAVGCRGRCKIGLEQAVEQPAFLPAAIGKTVGHLSRVPAQSGPSRSAPARLPDRRPADAPGLDGPRARRALCQLHWAAGSG